ncbi:MAG: transglycosylase domain-containing protein [Rikenellaceae bacterium]
MKKNANRNRGTRWIVYFWIAVATPVILLLVMLALTYYGKFGRLPSFEELENPKSNLATEIYSEDGEIMGTFFIENRSHLQYSELFPTNPEEHLVLDGYRVPPIVGALIATEDERFRSHGGVDIPSLFRVGIKTIAMQNSSQGGGSTITQQLAKNLFPRDTTRNQSKAAKVSKLVSAKFKEWITAVKLEYNYTKEEIAAMYLNTVTYGSNAYGIKAAAETFFNKQPKELNIQEAAILVGVVNAPTKYSPVRNPNNALSRRNTVISRLATAGAITMAQRDSLVQLPIELNYRPISNNYGDATYFREMLRLTMTAKRPTRNQFSNKWDYAQAVKQYDENPIYGWCHKNKRSDGENYSIYRDGLKIYTTINASMQRLAEEAVQKQLLNTIQPMMDAQAEELGTIFVDPPEGAEERIMRNAIRYSDRYFHMKDAGYDEEAILASFDKECKTKVFTFAGVRDTVMTPRDSILHHKRIVRASMVAVDPHSGEVKAYIGGPNFQYFKYDMAKQGKRQMGSTIKPLLYTFAIDHLGLTPCTPVQNLPVTIETAGGTPWSPKESGAVVYDGHPNPLQWGLAKSRNNYSAWIMKQAKQPQAVADFIHNLGIKSYIDPVWSLCLGAGESNPYEVASTYATFANRGVYTEPIFVTRIEDRKGNIIASFVPKSQDAINEKTAYTMLQMLQGVVKRGTAVRLTWAYGMYNMEIGGKTGTSQKNRDAWFVGVTPNLVVASWVGGEDQLIHLKSRGEGSVMALPIVGEFLTSIYKEPKFGISKRDKFTKPIGMPDFDYECRGNQETSEIEVETSSNDEGEESETKVTKERIDKSEEDLFNFFD